LLLLVCSALHIVNITNHVELNAVGSLLIMNMRLTLSNLYFTDDLVFLMEVDCPSMPVSTS
jgi:hypothetical protein